MKQLLTKISGTSALAVSVEDCKLDLRIDNTTDDLLIESYILAASDLCSEIVGKKLINETWKYSFKYVENNIVELPYFPVSEITEIQYYDSDNASQTLTISDFYLYNYDDIATIEPKLNITWPSTYSRKDALSITFIAGYGATSDLIPETIKRAIRLIVAHWYEHRTSASEINLTEIPHGVHHLLSVERVGWVA